MRELGKVLRPSSAQIRAPDGSGSDGGEEGDVLAAARVSAYDEELPRPLRGGALGTEPHRLPRPQVDRRGGRPAQERQRRGRDVRLPHRPGRRRRGLHMRPRGPPRIQRQQGQLVSRAPGRRAAQGTGDDGRHRPSQGVPRAMQDAHHRAQEQGGRRGVVVRRPRRSDRASRERAGDVRGAGVRDRVRTGR